MKLFIKQKINIFANLFLRPQGKFSFLNKIPKNSKILDLGCGNNSAFKIKRFLPDSYYVGIDVFDYNNKNERATARKGQAVSQGGGWGGPACWGEGQGAAPAKQQGRMTLTADITKSSKKTKWDRGKTVNIKGTNWQEVGG